MAEFEWLQQHLIAPGLLPARRFDTWLAGWSREQPLLRHLVERGVLDAGGAGTLSAAIKGYLRIEEASLVDLFRGGDEDVSEARSVDVLTDNSEDVSTDRSEDVSTARSEDVSTDRSEDVSGDRSEDVSGDRWVERAKTEPAAASARETSTRTERPGLGARWTGRHAPEEAHSPRVRDAVDAALSGLGGQVEPARPAAEGTSMAIAQGLERVLAAVQVWSGGLGLRPGGLPGGLERLTGELRGAAVTMTTRREQGGPFAGLTCATIRDANGALCSVTVIGLPAAGAPGPVLGIDLIGLGGALSLIAVDLAPVDRLHWDERAAAPLAGLHAALGDGAVARRWPEFAAEVFSPRAVIAGARRGAEAGLLAAVAGFVACLPGVYAPTRALPRARRIAADERVRAWRAAELRNRREHDALARIFGAGPAEAYLAALFGDGA